MGDGKSSVNVDPSSAAQPSMEQSGLTGSEDDQTMSAITERGDPIFDRWLETELQAEFGSVAAEPVPDTLLKLIESHRGKRG